MSPLKHFPLVSRRKIRPAELAGVYRVLRSSFGDQHWWPGETPFEVMIGAILTQNTAWANVEKAISNLKRAGRLDPFVMLKTKPTRLAALIRPAGYFNVKTRRILNFIKFYTNEYGGDPACMASESGGILRAKLLGVNGIGPETADSILLYAAGKKFFVIDAYTKRIFSRHGLLSYDADYHSWQETFVCSVPRHLSFYNDFHAQIVNLGKNFCRPGKPLCENCPLKRYLV